MCTSIDSIVDDGGKIVFDGFSYSSYAEAIYTFTSVDGKIRLSVTKTGYSNNLNTIDISGDISDYTFYTRNNGIDTEIPASSCLSTHRA